SEQDQEFWSQPAAPMQIEAGYLHPAVLAPMSRLVRMEGDTGRHLQAFRSLAARRMAGEFKQDSEHTVETDARHIGSLGLHVSLLATTQAVFDVDGIQLEFSFDTESTPGRAVMMLNSVLPVRDRPPSGNGAFHVFDGKLEYRDCWPTGLLYVRNMNQCFHDSDEAVIR